MQDSVFSVTHSASENDQSCVVELSQDELFAAEIKRINDVESIVPEGFRQLFPVVFATDDNYAPYCSVAIASIIKNASSENFYRIYVLHTDLSNECIVMLEGMSVDNLSVRCINVQVLISKCKSKLYRIGHFSEEMFYRFLIPTVFSSFPPVAYLDSDLVVNADIASIFQELGGALVAAVKNPVKESTAKHLIEDLNIVPEEYFNSGVMIININACLQYSFLEKCMDLVSPSRNMWNPDQDILNIVCRGRVLYLDPSWNFMWHYVHGTDYIKKIYAPIINAVNGNINIMHYPSGIKPWNRPDLELASHFWNYARYSPFYLELTAALGVQLKKYQSEAKGSILRRSIRYAHSFVRSIKEYGVKFTCRRVLVKLHICNDN